MSKTMLGTAIRAAKSERSKQEGDLAIIEENNEDSKIANYQDSELASFQNSKIASEQGSAPPIELVGLNIRVPKNHRLHWLIAAKKEGSSLTAAVNEALTARYGLPTEE